MQIQEESRQAPPRRWQPYPAERRPTVTAHAGCLGTEANSRNSFEAAIASGVDYLEADVRFTPEGEAYLSHDALPPEAMAGAMRLDELLAMAASAREPRLNLDLKEYSAMAALGELVTRRGMASRVLLTGVRLESVPAVRAGAGGLPYFLNAEPTAAERLTRRGAERLARRVRDCGAVGLNTHYRFATGALARALARSGLALSLWTVDDEGPMRRCIGLGADNVTTRRPDRLLALRDALAPARGRGAA